MNEILKHIIKVVKEVMETEEVNADTLMQEELGISSLEYYELLHRLEIEFDIRIPEKILSRVETVEDIAVEVEALLEKKL